ncbi:hypothetical protein RKE25_19970 [Dyella sp. BiH032]|uniref:hypothetical protein n=1 Tax=Dyella sp. BiH032 TaxID=3075430 RepID=UPI002892CF05|nr:hypothetical protein [Dyella sp. BiH032]WNL45663.1 hypothetical protein RKE25_19970 [Dyella sp. BiH032]
MSPIDEFKERLLEAEHVLDTEFSFDLAEPNYVRCLEVIAGNPSHRVEFAKALTGLFDGKLISDEPVAFLMHALRWPDVRSWAVESLRTMASPEIHGRPYEKIIKAYEPDWENREFYRSFQGAH